LVIAINKANVPPPRKLLLRLVVAIPAIALVGYLFSGIASSAFNAGVNVFLSLVYLAAYLVLVLAVPLVFFTLFRFFYSLWLKPWYRAWHINRIRHARYLREVINRGLFVDQSNCSKDGHEHPKADQD
jgi:hypothetical protein